MEDGELDWLNAMYESVRSLTYDEISANIDTLLGPLSASETVRVASEFGVTARTKAGAILGVNRMIEERKQMIELTDFRDTPDETEIQ